MYLKQEGNNKKTIYDNTLKEGKKVNRKDGRKERHTVKLNWILPVYNVGELFFQSKMGYIYFFIVVVFQRKQDIVFFVEKT